MFEVLISMPFRDSELTSESMKPFSCFGGTPSKGIEKLHNTEKTQTKSRVSNGIRTHSSSV